MIILGIVLAVLGWLLHIQLLLYAGVILIVIGAVLWILGATGNAVGGRTRWY